MTDIEDLEFRELFENYLDAIRDGEADEFLESLEDDQRERLLAFVLKETGK